MAESTPITPPSGFIMICNYGIDSTEDGGTKEGRILKNAFKNCPSPSVKKFGEVIVSNVSSSQPAEQEQSQSTNNQSQSEQSQNNSTQNSQESYNYSMLNAYLNLSVKSEADDNQSQQTNQTQQQTPSSDTDQQPSKSVEWSELYVETLLPKEGCTIWHIAIDKSADIESVTKSIKSKDFKAAYTIASKNSNADGIVVLSAKTYLNSKAECGCPFIGFCNYALDVGGDEGSEDEAISLAVAPFDARTGKPAREIVYKVTYNVTGDIMGGIVNKASAAKDAVVNKDADSNSDKQKDDETPLSKWLHKQQKCVGDKEMYDNYNKLRKFINTNVSKKLLNFSTNAEDTETVTHFAEVDAVKKSLIIY